MGSEKRQCDLGARKKERSIPAGNNNKYDIVRNNGGGKKKKNLWGAETQKLYNTVYLKFCIGEGNGNPVQCSCLGNPMDRGAWGATVPGVAKESDMTEIKQQQILWKK